MKGTNQKVFKSSTNPKNMNAILTYDESGLPKLELSFHSGRYFFSEKPAVEVHHGISPEMASEIIRTNGIRLAREHGESLHLTNFGVRTCDWQALEKGCRERVDRFNYN